MLLKRQQACVHIDLHSRVIQIDMQVLGLIQHVILFVLLLFPSCFLFLVLMRTAG
jgi:hypothetical protein